MSSFEVNGIDIETLMDENGNLRLPDGSYRICYYARYYNLSGGVGGFGENASNPLLGCASFTVCGSASAPQFIQPINNLSLGAQVGSVLPTSPVVFSWTPPQSTCGLPQGGYLYDFEIRELFPNQGVLDAINNPYVFRKTSLPTNTFLLDTLLYRNVLEQGKSYVIRVRATGVNASIPLNIENEGFSRAEAFQYGESALSITQVQTPAGTPDPLLSYLSYTERKTGDWDREYDRLLAGTRSDTLIPIEEFIGLKLMQNGTGYSLDAIELFYLLNPTLVNEKMVKLSHKANLPELPKVADTKSRKFIIEHTRNLQPDAAEENRFTRYLDSLNIFAAQQQLAENTKQVLNQLIANLNIFKNEIPGSDRVTVNTANTLLAELLFVLRKSNNNQASLDLSYLQTLSNDLIEITKPVVDATASIEENA